MSSIFEDDHPALRNPQAEQMADESMLRTLEHQIAAIWPHEKRLFSRYALPAGARILDLGCGSGQASMRLCEIFPGAEEVLGLDVLPELVTAACRAAHKSGRWCSAGQPPEVSSGRWGPEGPRLSFAQGDGFALKQPDEYFDLVVCRHVTQAVPAAERLLAEAVRVLKPGGWLHVLSEDYGMLHFPLRNGRDPDRLWHEAVVPFTQVTGTDARIGRRTLAILRELGLSHRSVQYLTIDTETAPREALIGIFSAWRDGYAEVLAQHSRFSIDEIRDLFAAVIETLQDPEGYGVWQVPVLAGQKPASSAAADEPAA
jgi:ubiquinone/menaquinone biosynthesis C-methylase UbiE